jgi:hypothetical protein
VDLWFKVNTWNGNSAPSSSYFWANSEYLPNSAQSWDGINLGNHPAYTSTGELLFGIYAGDWNWAHSGVVPQSNTWYHVAGTWGTNGINIYVNGALTGNNPYTGPAPAFTKYNLIGRSSWPQSQIDGRVDEVEIFNRALSQGEIYAIYAAGPAGKCKPCNQEMLVSTNLGGSYVLTWPCGGMLQSAPTLQGPWTDLPDAVSPYAMPACASNSFYRFKCN